MNIGVGWRKLYSVHVHTNGDKFALIGTPVHHLKFDQSLCFCFIGSSRSKCLLSDQTNLHSFDFDFDKVKVYSSNNYILQMIEGFVVLKVNMKTVLDSHLHFHWNDLIFLYLIVGQQYGEINLFCYCGFH